jgi:hypothetical protein
MFSLMIHRKPNIGGLTRLPVHCTRGLADPLSNLYQLIQSVREGLILAPADFAGLGSPHLPPQVTSPTMATKVPHFHLYQDYRVIVGLRSYLDLPLLS